MLTRVFVESDRTPSVAPARHSGSIHGLGETFAPQLFTGTGDYVVPIQTSPPRAGPAPTLALRYGSGAGNGPFGWGWTLDLPCVRRRTEKRLPRYDATDTFVLSHVGELVPSQTPSPDGSTWSPTPQRSVDGWRVERFRPRSESGFARIERWTHDGTDEVHWRIVDLDNVTSVFGRTAAARITDPTWTGPLLSAPTFEWCLEERFDALGNHVLYTYADEIPSAAPEALHEAGRTHAQRYLRRIFYGTSNQPVGPRRRGLDHEHPTTERDRYYAFEVVLDYGDAPTPSTGSPQRESTSDAWPVRPDPFSTYRPGFELRTLRRCERVQMVHHFAELGGPTVVRTTELEYATSPRQGYSMLRSVRETAPVPNTDRVATTPRLKLGYTSFEPNRGDLVELTCEGGALPAALFGGSDAVLADVDGNGLPDFVRSTHDAMWRWRNQGRGRFARPESMGRAPGVRLSAANVSLSDVTLNARADLVVLGTEAAGYYAAADTGGWGPFRSFPTTPSFSPTDPRVRMVDLTGDGRADALLTSESHFVWYENLGVDGFAAPRVVPRPRDDAYLLGVDLADSTGRVRFADMTGDGLQDLVVLRDGAVCYWPNLGYGRFGPRVRMSTSPRLGHDFDPGRVFLADLDGSGCCDLICVDPQQVRYWMNQSGNGWSETQLVRGTPRTHAQTTLRFVDVLGTGTATLVWSEAPSLDAAARYWALDFCSGKKPHLLASIESGTGAETTIRYGSSVEHALRAAEEGQPWVTRLPFAVHVVDRIETHCRISKTRRVSRFTYDHGHYDAVERELSGFGLVTARDAEALPLADAPTQLAPVVTKRWFHTGASPSTSTQAWYVPTGATAPRWSQPPSVLPTDLAPGEHLQASRAMRGAPLREEVYAEDGTDAAHLPYRVTTHAYGVHRIQPRDGDTPGAFQRVPRESVTHDCERNPEETRTTHHLTLETNAVGHPLREVQIAYGRVRPDDSLPLDWDRDQQSKSLVTYTAHRYCDAIDTASTHRGPALCETRVFELVNVVPAGTIDRASFDGWTRDDFARVESTAEVPFEHTATTTAPQRRLVRQSRTLFRADDLTQILPLGVQGALGLPGEAYDLAFTPGLITQTLQRDGLPLLVDPNAVLGADGGYVRSDDLKSAGLFEASDPDGHWWVPSGRVYLSTDPSHTPAEELAFARAHFFLPARFVDPWGASNTVTYDPYDLLIVETRDAVENRTTVGERAPDGTFDPATSGNDYRALRAATVMDPNRNRTRVAFDALGLVVGSAVMGKPETAEGDALASFDSNPTATEVEQWLSAPTTAPPALGDATTRTVHDTKAYTRTAEATSPQPCAIQTIARETHTSEVPPNATARTQHRISYFDGFGREIQTKALVRAGPIVDGGPSVARRWVGSGWTVYDNKGDPVRVYEPFFSDTPTYESERTAGVSTVHFYDPLRRVVARLFPNATYEKVRFDPWHHQSWDANDTVLGDPRTDPDVAGFTSGYFDNLDAASAAAWQTWYEARVGGVLGLDEQQAALRTAPHANTPASSHFDAMGRPFLTTAHNRVACPGHDLDGTEQQLATRFEVDILGQTRVLRDATVHTHDPRGRIVSETDYDLLGRLVYRANLDAGRRWMLPDASGAPLLSWDDRGHTHRVEYDALRRPVRRFVRTTAGEALVGQTTYGEGAPNDVALNLRGQVIRQNDGAGTDRSLHYDFKGNLLRRERELQGDGRSVLNWLMPPATGESFAVAMTYDALNRTTSVTAPDGTVQRSTYDEANFLQHVDVQLPTDSTPTRYLVDVEHDARGRRKRISYGNGVSRALDYDPLSRRLVRIRSGRTQPIVPGDLQDQTNTYDPVGNVIHRRDDAQQSLFFRNHRVDPHASFRYDAVYRLIEATGREHRGQATRPTSPHDATVSWSANDGSAMGRYLERYVYDAAGNLSSLTHRGADPAQPGWTRRYEYVPTSGSATSNRLLATRVGVDRVEYRHDAHGNMTRLEANLHWDHQDRLQRVDLAGGGVVYHTYGAGGERVRKVWEKSPGLVEERIYLGDFEVFRSTRGSANLERQTTFVRDGGRTVAQIDRRTAGDDGSPRQLTRYVLDDLSGSSALELDDRARILSYEEYLPYGGTAYQAVDMRGQAPKRHRYASKERDEETGLYAFGARSYAPWLGRWISCDPAGEHDGLNRYRYVQGNPIRYTDPNGMETEETAQQQEEPTVAGDIWNGVKSVPKALVEPLLLAADIASSAGVYVHNENVANGDAPGEYPIEPTDVEFLSFTGERIRRNIIEDRSEWQNLRAGAVTATAMPTGGATVLIDNIATVFEEDMKPREAQSFLTSAAAAQTTMAAISSGYSTTRGGGWNGRGSGAVEAADQTAVDTLVEYRAANDTSSHGTLGTGRTRSGQATPVRESMPRPRPESGEPIMHERSSTHAEPQVAADLPTTGGRTIAVDQLPCGACTAELGLRPSAWEMLWGGEMTGSLRVVVPRNPAKPTGSPKTAAVKAAEGKASVVPELTSVTPLNPPAMPTPNPEPAKK